MVRIFVPVNFSDYSINAVQYAIGLGQKIPSTINLICCCPKLIEPDSNDDTPLNTKIKLNKLRDDLENEFNDEQKSNINLLARTETGYPEDVLVSISNKEDPDVIIMGTRSKGETIKELIGSVTSDIIKNAKVPVLAVPPNSHFKINQINNILFIADFSDTDYRSLHKLIRLVTPFQTRIYAVHFTASTPDKWDKKRLEEIRYYCQKTYRNYQIDFDFITGEDFINSLDSFTSDNNISLIAMTRRKRNMISKLLHPSITRKILFHTDIPLLVFHE